eukprot:17863-Heterococcus_DN1.PRE.3
MSSDAATYCCASLCSRIYCLRDSNHVIATLWTTHVLAISTAGVDTLLGALMLALLTYITATDHVPVLAHDA